MNIQKYFSSNFFQPNRLIFQEVPRSNVDKPKNKKDSLRNAVDQRKQKFEGLIRAKMPKEIADDYNVKLVAKKLALKGYNSDTLIKIDAYTGSEEVTPGHKIYVVEIRLDNKVYQGKSYTGFKRTKMQALTAALKDIKANTAPKLDKPKLNKLTAFIRPKMPKELQDNYAINLMCRELMKKGYSPTDLLIKIDFSKVPYVEKTKAFVVHIYLDGKGYKGMELDMTRNAKIDALMNAVKEIPKK